MVALQLMRAGRAPLLLGAEGPTARSVVISTTWVINSISR